MIVAYNIGPGFSDLSSQLATVAHKCNQVIPQYRSMFEKSSESIIKQKESLRQAALATDDIASKLGSVGDALESKRGKFYYPDSLDNIGRDLKIYSNTVAALSAVIRDQIQVLEQFKSVTLPLTLEVFDEISEFGKCSEQTAKNIASDSQAALILTLLICGLLFLLNGIGLIFIAKVFVSANE